MRNTIYKSLTLILLMLGIFAGKYWYLSPKYGKGEKIPTFSAQLADGSNFELASLQGKYVLLQFWGSWCGPCRKENPELVSLYSDLKNAGFDIVSIGLEKNAATWQKAIVSDRLIWPYHILQEGGFDSELAQLYTVRQIPTLYLLGPDHKVILTNPSPIQVRNYVTDHPL